MSNKNDFEDMMFGSGIKPLKGSKKGKKAKKSKKTNQENKKRDNHNEFADLMQEEISTPYFMVDEDDSKKSFADFMGESKKDPKEVIDFEDALKIYDPKGLSNIKQNSNSNKNHKVIYKKQYSNISLDDILHKVDLHGFNLSDAKKEVEQELSFCVKERIKIILIVTGKGKHSKNGAIIKIAVEKMLLSFPTIIEMIEYAPISAGGDGAFIVWLR